MKNEVHIYLDGQAVMVDGRYLPIKGISLSLIIDKLPSNVDFSGVKSMGWSGNMGLPQKGYIGLSNGSPFVFGEDKYIDYIQPYVDLWQAEKDRIEQERHKAEEEYNSFPNVKARKLDELNVAHEAAKARAHVLSSLGFEIDANDRANRDVEGILRTIGDGTTMFCDYRNKFHELNKAQVETLQLEIIQNAQALYAQKWQYRAQVEGAESAEELEALEFTFSHLSF